MLLEQIADSRVAGMTRRDGMQLAEHERGVVIGQLRRQLSTVAMRAGTQCLLGRMHQCGQGAAMAAKRREVNLKVCDNNPNVSSNMFDIAINMYIYIS